MKDKDYIKLLKLKEKNRKDQDYIHYLKRKISLLEDKLNCAYEALDHWVEECEEAQAKEKALRDSITNLLKASDETNFISSSDKDLPF